MIFTRNCLRILCGSRHQEYSTSRASKGVFDPIRSFWKKKQEEREHEFQTWAEFENRGFRKPEYMDCWIIEKYGEPKEVLKKDIINVQYDKFKSFDAEHSRMRQAVKNPCDVLIKVHAASLNPVDVYMCNGYLHRLMNFRRSVLMDTISQVVSLRDHTEFPLVLGRDFSGTVVDVGSGVFDLVPGDEVYGTQELHRIGTLADYATVHLRGLCQKPATLSHIEAASLPYVASTVMSALSDLPQNTAGKRCLLLGGAGGIGTFAIQFLKSKGFSVSVSCSDKSMSLCSSLGADTCYDYKSPNFSKEIEQDARFDLLFDILGVTNPDWAVDLLNRNGTYVTLKTPLADYTDKLGLLWGLSATASEYIFTKIRRMEINVKWGMYTQNRNALLHVAKLVDGGSLKPVIQKVFTFDEVPEAFNLVSSGHTKGKVVVNVSGLPEATHKPDIEKIIHL